ncbi:DHA2 family efflux MFS transporter permease subunit [Nonomuraea sp. NBC_00507]|uniref:DHA2 family efflux MFS transporter permease subunit n=1 Tax=Nonomuraea sp. NBC_00507 TaxID=2976002 RepID=UPI002E1862A7
MGIVLIATPVLATIDATAVGIAADAMAAHFRAPLTDVQWVATAYLLAIAVVMPLSGWLSERYGAKRMWIIAVVVFTAGSALCGLAWSLPALVAFRLVQAIGGGLMNPIAQSILAQAAGPSRIGRAMTVLMVPVMFAPVLGPIVGGVVVQQLDWRWIFYLNLPICLVVLPFAARLLPRDEDQPQTTSRLDVLGLALLSPGLALVVYALTMIGGHGGSVSPNVVIALVAGLLLIAAYLLHALRTHIQPLIDVRLFAGRGFTAACATFFLLGASLYSSMILLPLFFQHVQHASTLSTGLLLTPQALGAAAGSYVAGRLTDRYGPRAVVASGLVLSLAGLLAFTQAPAEPGIGLLTLCLVLYGLGIGGVSTTTMTAAYSSVEKRQTPHAAGALNVLYRLGGSIGTAILTTVLDSRLRQGAAPAAAYATTFWWAFGLCLVALVPVALFPSSRRSQQLGAAD